MIVAERLYPGRVGGQTGQTLQFRDPQGPGHGGVKVELAPGEYAQELSGVLRGRGEWRSAADVIEAMGDLPRALTLIFHAESAGSEGKYVKLSERTDRFGDAFPHVHYELSDFDRATYERVQGLVARFTGAVGPAGAGVWPIERYSSAYHHMATCRMGADPASSVVDPLGRVHGVDGVYLAGSSVFAGGSGAVNPTLTIVALAVRTADALIEILQAVPLRGVRKTSPQGS
jgi:choline dehydrogenase-like flavoprotein